MAPRLLDLGLPRTGTQSLANALQILGYDNVYHMREVDKNEGHRALWIQLIDDKFGPSAASRQSGIDKQLQKSLKDYDAVADFPAALFPLELHAAFPHAKIVVTVRGEDAWYRSMLSTLAGPSTKRKSDHSMRSHTMSNSWKTYCWDDDFEANGRRFWRNHMQMLKDSLPEGKVLYYDVSSGWAPLCDFLGVSVPDQPFPNADDWREHKWKRGNED